jgi:transglutaminase-like putative cysteine protease
MAITTASGKPTFVTRYQEHIYFQDGALLTGILAALIFLIVATALDAAGHVPSMALLIPVSLGASLLGILMSYSRFDGFFALSHSMFTGLAWIFYLMTSLVGDKEIETFLEFGIPELQAQVYYVLWKLLNWVDAAMSRGASNDNYVFVFQICFLIWWLTYLGIWAIFRYGYTWRAVIPAGLVLMINTYYAPKSVVGFLIVFCLVALIFLVRTNLAEHQLRWREQRVYFSQDISLDFLRNGLLYSILVLALAWLAPGLGRNPQVRALMSPINDTFETANAQLTTLYGSLNRAPRSREAAFGSRLSLGGERMVQDMPVFTVSSNSGGRYWRAVAFDTFDGRQWENTLRTATEFEADTPLPVANWQERTPITQTITLLAPTGNVIFGPPDIRQVSLPIEAIAQPAPADSIFIAPQASGQLAPAALELTYARARNPLEVNDSYTVVSHFTQVTRRTLENSSTEYPQTILDKYLQLPENFSPRIAQTAITVTTRLLTPYDKAKAIEGYLRTITYNDTIAAPPPNVDPIEYFLYDLREGYCDYYATAMVLMLRHLGIPSRAVSGYAEGAFDEESGLYYVTDRDAHTWVEVFFPNLGWVEFEPTAGESPLERLSGDDPVGASGLGNIPEPPQGTPGNLGDPLQDQLQDELFNQAEGGGFADEFDTGQSRWWVWVVLTPILLGVAFWWLRHSDFWGPTTFTPELPPMLYDRLHRWAERLGLHLRVSDTPYEQADQLGKALPEGRPFIRTIADSYVRYRFSRPTPGEHPTSGLWTPTTRSANEGLVLSWQQLNPLLWRAWMRRFLRWMLRQKSDPFALGSVKE